MMKVMISFQIINIYVKMILFKSKLGFNLVLLLILIIVDLLLSNLKLKLIGRLNDYNLINITLIEIIKSILTLFTKKNNILHNNTHYC